MSILIKGMEMPKNCYECDFCTYGYCPHLNSHVSNSQERDSDCPIIELPPHGDLIDRDEQIERAWRLNLSTRELIVTMLKTAPTILEAEVEK